MKNSVFAVLLLSIILLSVAAVAQEGRYVRKKLTPNFFIPQSELERREVLPPFYYEEPKPAPKPKAVQQQPLPEEEMIGYYDEEECQCCYDYVSHTAPEAILMMLEEAGFDWQNLRREYLLIRSSFFL